MTDIKVPTLGESVSEATVAQWLKQEGDTVSADEPIVELETDKVTLEVNAPAGGVITKITVAAGENVGVGAVLGVIGEGSAANDTKAKSAKAEEKKEAAPKEEKAESKSSDNDADQKLPPAVRKLVDENDIDPSKIKGSGKDGRITKGDVLEYMEGGADTSKKSAGDIPAPDAVPLHKREESTKGPREERVKMTRLRMKIAERLKEAQNTAAMLTTFNEVDMSAVMDMRAAYKEGFEKKHGVKLGFMSFFVKACVNALQEFPAVNAMIDGDDIVYKNHYDIGVAVSTPQGLVVPVVRDCEDKSMADVEKQIMEYGLKARDGKIQIDDMTGGTFTITNGGTFGSMMSTPILNTPQSGILGMHNIVKRAMVMPDGSIQARPMMYLALSYDHRIVDGKEAVSFLVRIKQAIEDPQRLLLDM